MIDIRESAVNRIIKDAKEFLQQCRNNNDPDTFPMKRCTLAFCQLVYFKQISWLYSIFQESERQDELRLKTKVKPLYIYLVRLLKQEGKIDVFFYKDALFDYWRWFNDKGELTDTIYQVSLELIDRTLKEVTESYQKQGLWEIREIESDT